MSANASAWALALVATWPSWSSVRNHAGVLGDAARRSKIWRAGFEQSPAMTGYLADAPTADSPRSACRTFRADGKDLVRQTRGTQPVYFQCSAQLFHQPLNPF